MQGHLLSSSYCVRLGRLRFRTAYMATGREAEGARGDSRQRRLVHTPRSAETRRRGAGGGGGRWEHTSRQKGCPGA